MGFSKICLIFAFQEVQGSGFKVLTARAEPQTPNHEPRTTKPYVRI